MDKFVFLFTEERNFVRTLLVNLCLLFACVSVNLWKIYKAVEILGGYESVSLYANTNTKNTHIDTDKLHHLSALVASRKHLTALRSAALRDGGFTVLGVSVAITSLSFHL